MYGERNVLMMMTMMCCCVLARAQIWSGWWFGGGFVPRSLVDGSEVQDFQRQLLEINLRWLNTVLAICEHMSFAKFLASEKYTDERF